MLPIPGPKAEGIDANSIVGSAEWEYRMPKSQLGGVRVGEYTQQYAFCDIASRYYVEAESRVVHGFNSKVHLNMACAPSLSLWKTMNAYRDVYLVPTMFGDFAYKKDIDQYKDSWSKLYRHATDHTEHNPPVFLSFAIRRHKKELTIVFLETLPSFRAALKKCKRDAKKKDSYANFISLLKYYNKHIAPSIELSWHMKAGWMLRHTWNHEAICSDNMIMNSFLLMNYCLVLHGLPFPLSFDFDNIDMPQSLFSLGLKMDDETELADWILAVTYWHWVKFDEMHTEKLLEETNQLVAIGKGKVSSVAGKSIQQQKVECEAAAVKRKKEDEELRDKAIAQYRESLKRESFCFICMDDTVRPTVALLCCGQACHVNCVSRWHKTQSNQQRGSSQGEEKCPNCRQDCPEPDEFDSEEVRSEY
ncbi:MAG: hypothetical protein EOO94_00195 [Pedobacter sp.]|nr:MAG: hypothetical protein EOO94_00195 [Pedobacter sp.]